MKETSEVKRLMRQIEDICRGALMLKIKEDDLAARVRSAFKVLAMKEYVRSR